MENYDLVIVGMGFSGYTGAIYGARYGMKTLIIGEAFGGQTAEAHLIGNYPGFEEITGIELMQKVQAQATKLGTKELYGRVTKIVTNNEPRYKYTLTIDDKTEINAENILLTIGMKRKQLMVPGEKEFYGKGVTYCATCDGYFYKGKEVAVVGGGDSAVTAAIYLADLCPKVHLLVRKDKLRAEQYWLDKLEQRKNIIIHFNTIVEQVIGKDTVTAVQLSGETETLPIEGLFIEIGHEPLKELTTATGIALDEFGYIIVDKEGKTSVPGIYAAGDSTTASNKFAQLITAAGEAAVAVESISMNRV